MTGTIELCNKNRAEYFFIQGDDGIRYFGHRHQAIDRKNYNQFCYKGNRVTFVPTDQEEEGKAPSANQIWFEEVDKHDMWKKEERERVMKIVWDVLHEGVCTDTVADQDYVYEQIRNRVEKMY